MFGIVRVVGAAVVALVCMRHPQEVSGAAVAFSEAVGPPVAAGYLALVEWLRPVSDATVVPVLRAIAGWFLPG